MDELLIDFTPLPRISDINLRGHFEDLKSIEESFHIVH